MYLLILFKKLALLVVGFTLTDLSAKSKKELPQNISFQQK